MVETERGFAEFEEGIAPTAEALFAGLGLLAFTGLVVAWVEIPDPGHGGPRRVA